jgi:hypothetical protein
MPPPLKGRGLFHCMLLAGWLRSKPLCGATSSKAIRGNERSVGIQSEIIISMDYLALVGSFDRHWWRRWIPLGSFRSRVNVPRIWTTHF